MGAKVIGGILNMVENKPQEVKRWEVENALETSIICTIPYDNKVKEALYYETPFVVRFPNSRPAKEVMRLAAGLIGKDYHPEKGSIFARILNFFRNM
jgi:MinD-like ATPase involved in chromosome partitioning or flagellar assembly